MSRAGFNDALRRIASIVPLQGENQKRVSQPRALPWAKFEFRTFWRSLGEVVRYLAAPFSWGSSATLWGVFCRRRLRSGSSADTRRQLGQFSCQIFVGVVRS